MSTTPNSPTAREDPVWWVDDETFATLREAGVTLYEGTDRRGPYRTGWTKAELRLARALLTARRGVERMQSALRAIENCGKMIEHRIEQVETTDGPDHALVLFNRFGAEGWQFAGVLRRLSSSDPFCSFDECVFTRTTREPSG